MKNTPIHQGSARNRREMATSQTSVTNPNGLLGRRTFMKRLGLGGTALVPASSLLTGRTVARAAGFGGERSACLALPRSSERGAGNTAGSIIDASNRLQMVFPTSGDLSDAIVQELLKGAGATNPSTQRLTIRSL